MPWCFVLLCIARFAVIQASTTGTGFNVNVDKQSGANTGDTDRNAYDCTKHAALYQRFKNDISSFWGGYRINKDVRMTFAEVHEQLRARTMRHAQLHAACEA